eukprot:TRINITY_DN13523_c0_g2_i1.p1 TRINITY_DN13523_c0_g2~~TRINITY_DN13523_c0_g2_i1.p1  ORF type:complete len:127 (+),score=23.13 TRINITY_DN13523_c0_g2_i1:68-448(+)
MSEGRQPGVPRGGVAAPMSASKFSPLAEDKEKEVTSKIDDAEDKSNSSEEISNKDETETPSHTPEQVAKWVKYHEDVKNYMIRYAAYHAGLQAQKNVEEALAMRAAQAAIITAQHMTMDPPRNKRM